MNKIQELYNKYQMVIMSYEGKETNWSNKILELESIRQELKRVKLSNSKNVVFAEYVKKSLMDDIATEIKRIAIIR